jgi:hypothetical protein
MRKLALGVALASLLAVSVGIPSFVYACDRSSKTEAVRADAVTPGIIVDVAVPLDHIRVHRVSMVCSRTRVVFDEPRTAPVETVKRTAKVAATLGRALVTTVCAVVGSLVDAATDATARLV